jgi:hypothetical protein
MTSENGGRRTRRSNGPLLETAEGLATGVGRLGYGIFSLGLGLLPKQSRQHVHNAIHELGHAFATIPGDFADVVSREVERWAAGESAPTRSQRIAIDSEMQVISEVPITSEVEVNTVATLGAGAAALPALVSITHIEFDPPGRDRDGEYVLLRNDGTVAADLTGWTLADGGAAHTYTFPAFSLAPGAEVKLWTRDGSNDATNLFWSSPSAIWNNTGDSATLNDASGAKMAGFSYETKKA